MNKLLIIVPFRNREGHLKKFIPHINKFLSEKILFDILVVEQCDTKPFNRAKLFNIGFDLNKDYDYYCFHDVDLLPVDENCDYSYNQGITKLSYYVSQFNFIPRPTKELGGVTLIDKNNFLLVNGFCNEYWGWGVEDNDFGLRCEIKKVPFSLRTGKYMSLPHTPNGDTYGNSPSQDTINNRKYFNNVLNNQDDKLFSSGLTDLKYELLETIEKKDYKISKVVL